MGIYIIKKNKIPAGAITVTGLRPHEDHQVIVKALEKLF